MDEKEIKKILEKTNVLLEGHFLLTSGKHSGKYMQCAKIFEYPDQSEIICSQLVQKIKNSIKTRIDVVIGPAIGAILLSYEIARQLGIRSVFGERKNGKMVLGRSFSIKSNENVLIVEDVITTGGSVKEIIEILKKNQANILGIGMIIDRQNKKNNFEIPFESVLKVKIKTFDKDECPFCKENIPLIKPGSKEK
ncbi:MAG: orotate phosphoribosyltransferase [Clostridiales bacterium]|nr:orotate phosphoribosyltransferase [Clostridiales bacterium]